MFCVATDAFPSFTLALLDLIAGDGELLGYFSLRVFVSSA